MALDNISGSGGGGKSGSSSGAVAERVNNLRSNSIAKVIFVLGEGMNRGLVNGQKSIYLNGTPLMNADGSLNFQGVGTWENTGWPEQPPIPFMNAIESYVGVNQFVTKTTPVTVTISNANVDDVLAIAEVPALMDLEHVDAEYYVGYQWWIKASGKDYVPVAFETINGKTNSPYQRATRITNLRSYGPPPWNLRMTRYSDDHEETSNIQDKTMFAGYTEIVNSKFSWPYVHHVGLVIDASQFGNSVPSCEFEFDGQALCYVPSNYDPVARTYSGIWDGTFKFAYTDNPAWCWYTSAINWRWGARVDPSIINKWVIYEIGKYCDYAVPDGEGGTRPRFTLNVNMETQDEAYNVMNDIASAFMAMPFWGAGAVNLSQDWEDTVYKYFGPQNVIDGKFSYSSTALKARHSVAHVSFKDPDDEYRDAIEVYEDPEMILRYGWNPVSVTRFGCTNRNEARTHGKFIIETEKHCKETVVFVANLEGYDCLPGKILGIVDPKYMGIVASGRLVGVTANTATLDRPIDLDGGGTYTLTMMRPEPLSLGEGVPPSCTITNTITTVGTDKTTIQFSSDLTDAPKPQSMWILRHATFNPREFKVLAHKEIAPHQYEITALEYDRGIYPVIFNGAAYEKPPNRTIIPTGEIAPPTNLLVEEKRIEISGITYLSLLVSWTHVPDPRVVYYEVQYSKAGQENWIEYKSTSESSIDIYPLNIGDYDVRVRACGTGKSVWAYARDNNLSGGATVPDVTGLNTTYGSYQFQGRDCEMVWNSVVNDLFTASQLFVYEVVVKDSSTDAVKRTEYVSVERYVYTYEKNKEDFGGTPSRTIKFEVKAMDRFDNLSTTAAIATISNPAPTMAGYSPTTDPQFTGMSVSWKTFTVTDPDLSRFEIRIQESSNIFSPAPTELPHLSGTIVTAYQQAGADGYFHPVPVRTPDVVYFYAQVIPWDAFGVGVASNVVYGVADPNDLLTILEGQISESQLTADLLAQIENAGIEDMDIIAAMANGVWPTPYAAGINYSLGQWCSYNNAGIDDVYVVKLETPSAGIVPTNTTYWRKAHQIVQTFYDQKKVEDVLSADITAAEGDIQLRALKGTLSDPNYTLSAAEMDISAVEGAITSKVWMSDVDVVSGQVYSVQSEVAQKNNEWTVKVDANGNCVGMGLIAYPNWSAQVTYAHPSMVYYASTAKVYKTKSAPPKGTVPTNTTYWSETATTKDQVIFRTTTFAIVHGDTPTDLKYPFMVGQTPAGSTVGINGQLVVSDSISAASIKTEELYIPYGQITDAPVDKTFLIRASGSYSSSGVDSYLKTGDGVTTIFGPSTIPNATGRSWNLAVYDCTTDAWVKLERFDIYTTASRASDLYGLINGNYTDPRYLIALFTNDEPRTNVLSGTLTYASEFIQTLIDLGATRQFLNSTDFKFRSAYVLLGKWHQGEGRGLQWYAGATDSSASAQINLTVGIDRYRKEWVQVTTPNVAPNGSAITPFRMQPPPASAPGLWLQPTQMGYWNGTEWRAAIDSTGKFYFAGETGKYISYNGTTLTIRGSMYADDITAGSLSVDRLTANSINYDKIYTSGVDGAITNCSYEFPSNSYGVNCSSIQWIATVTFNVPYESKVLITGYIACQTLSTCFEGSCWTSIERMHWEYYNGYYQWVSQGYIAASTSSIYEAYQYMYGNISIADVPLLSGDYQYRLKMSAYAYEGSYDNRQITYNFNILNKRLMGLLIKR
jgi:predicted phage tail protein